MEKQYAVLLDGEPRKTNSAGGIRTYKTRERARKENEYLKKGYYKGSKIEVVEVAFINKEEIQ